MAELGREESDRRTCCSVMFLNGREFALAVVVIP